MTLAEHASGSWRVTRLQAALAVVLAVAGFFAVTQIRNELLIRQDHAPRDASRAGTPDG